MVAARRITVGFGKRIEGGGRLLPEAYAYLLGVYLGDGCIIVTSSGAACLVIVLDARYPGVVAEVADAIAQLFPDTPVGVDARPGAKAVRVNHPCLPFAFPNTPKDPSISGKSF